MLAGKPSNVGLPHIDRNGLEFVFFDPPADPVTGLLRFVCRVPGHTKDHTPRAITHYRCMYVAAMNRLLFLAHMRNALQSTSPLPMIHTVVQDTNHHIKPTTK